MRDSEISTRSTQNFSPRSVNWLGIVYSTGEFACVPERECSQRAIDLDWSPRIRIAGVLRAVLAATATVSMVVFVTGCAEPVRAIAIPSGMSTSADEGRRKEGPTASLLLSKVVMDVPYGKPVISFPNRGLPYGLAGTDCNLSRAYTETWDQGRILLDDWRGELGDVFFEVMSESGFNLAVDPSSMFGQVESAQSAEYQIGARIADMRGNFCDEHSSWDGLSLGTYRGEMYMCIEWTVFSNLARREVATVASEGYGRQSEGQPNGVARALRAAFADATQGLSENVTLQSIVEREGSAIGINAEVGAPINLPVVMERQEPIGGDVAAVLDGVVTIRSGSAHGSGFVVGSEGEILTNSHVVGAAERVVVVFENGIEVDAAVERVNRARDVALVRAPMRTRNAMAIREATASSLEEVFAVGTPANEIYSATITRGVVSADRRIDESGYTFIQADAAVSPGSSGGPLIDSRGNVIGMSVAKATGQGVEGVGLFIPIHDALASLNVVLGDETSDNVPALESGPRPQLVAKSAEPSETAGARCAQLKAAGVGRPDPRRRTEQIAYYEDCVESAASERMTRQRAARYCRNKARNQYPDFDSVVPPDDVE